MKYLTLLIFTSLSLVTFAQSAANKTNLPLHTDYYTHGPIAELPDTILLFTSYSQINPRQNYSELKQTKKGTYQLLYWETEKGGIVDPALYKYNLHIKSIHKTKVKLSVGNKKKTYSIRKLKNNEEFYYELTGGHQKLSAPSPQISK